LQTSPVWLVMFVLLLLVCGCTRKDGPGAKRPNVDRSQEVRPEEPLEPLTVAPIHIEARRPENFLHKVFSVSNHTQFEFVVPPHQRNARLHGDFRSFTKRGDPDSTSDKAADVDLILLNEQEFDDFLHGRPGSSTCELDPAHNQMVDWRVPTTYGESQTYHLVFSNSAGGTKIKFVKADFTVSFE
jgi:hypothetical protein